MVYRRVKSAFVEGSVAGNVQITKARKEVDYCFRGRLIRERNRCIDNQCR